MKKYLSLLLVVLPLISFAQEEYLPPLESDSELEIGPEAGEPTEIQSSEKDEKGFVYRKGHWVSSFGFERIEYPTPYNFITEKVKIKPDEQALWGMRAGFGREFHLFGGLLTTTMLEGYYMGTLFEKTKSAGKDDTGADYDLKFTGRKDVGQIWGGDLVQSISYMFHMKTRNPVMDEWAYFTIEPFVEVGIGMAKAYNRVNYYYDTTGANYTSGAVKEAYRNIVQDSLLNNKIGAGIKLTSTKGYFLYLRATQNNYSITERTTKVSETRNGVSTPHVNTKGDAEFEKPIMIYAIGGGYKF